MNDNHVPEFLNYNSGENSKKIVTRDSFIKVKNDETEIVSYIQLKNLEPYVEVKKKASKKAIAATKK